jgi:chromosome segregation ATPase
MITREKISNILLMIFAIISLLLFLTINKNKEIYKTDISKLEHINDSLLQHNDSLNLVNVKLTNDIININSKVDSVNTVLTKTEVKIKKIKDEKIKIISRLSHLHADSVAIYFTNYLSKGK